MSYRDEFDAYLTKGPLGSGSVTPLGNLSNAVIYNPISESVQAPAVVSGSQIEPLMAGKTTFTDTKPGYWWGFDPVSHQFKWIVSTVIGSMDFNVTNADTLTVTGIVLTGGSISYGKTSFADSVHAGYYISSSGVYFGAAADATYLKYDIGAATLAYVGTISGRSSATLAAAINAAGNLITDVINTKLDTSAKNILAGFQFGSTDYSGAVNAGNITWNTTTGAITGGSGVLLYRGGIVGVSAGVTKFSIDATTGAATFAGALSAPTGSIGGFTIGATDLSAASGGNTTTVSSGATAFSAGPTGSPTIIMTQAGVATFTNVIASNVGAAWFGDGSDGDVTISADTSLSRDMYYNNLTVNTGKTLDPNGYRIFVKNTLTINGTGKISRNGIIGGNGTNAVGLNKGLAGVAGAALPSGSVAGSLAGNNGGDGGVGGIGPGGGASAGIAGVNGVNSSKCITTVGVIGAVGGQGGSGGFSGGAAGTAGSNTGTVINTVKNPTAAYNLFDLNGTAIAQLNTGSSSGGSGGGGGGALAGLSTFSGAGGGGGASGGNGGILPIFARYIVNNGTISANGGNGGNGGNGSDASGGASGTSAGGGGGGAAGSGGTGGAVILVYNTFTGNAPTASGGSPGTIGSGGRGVVDGVFNPIKDGANGSVGTAGNAGVVISITNL